MFAHCDIFEFYIIEHLLRNTKTTSPGLDGIPSCFLRHCSFELADAVAHILWDLYNDWNVFLAVALCHCYPSTQGFSKKLSTFRTT